MTSSTPPPVSSRQMVKLLNEVGALECAHFSRDCARCGVVLRQPQVEAEGPADEALAYWITR